MCNLCSCYIYDTLVNPLPLNHYLREKIKMNGIIKYAGQITKCLEDTMDKFWLSSESDSFKHYFKMFEGTLKNIEDSKEATLDCFVWNKFNTSLKSSTNEMQYIFQQLIDNGYQTDKDLTYMRQYFMNKLRILIFNLKEIHEGHTEKKKYINPTSKISLCPHKLMEIRKKAGLPYIIPDTPYEYYEIPMLDLYD